MILASAACQTNSISLTDQDTICTALVGPIRYNSKNQASVYYAGKMLVFTLKERNAVWIKMGCKEK